MSKVVLKCDNLSKKMGDKQVVLNVSFNLYEKDILGFVGLNGAGKTTIIKLILGLYKKDTGKILIDNYDIDKDFTKAISRVGAIIENPDMYMYMTGYENLMISANIYNISEERVRDVVRLVDLENSINVKVSKYSLGMRQRLGIAQAIIHNPKILILDEPTNGLDPQGIIQLNLILKKLAKQGMSVIVSSHILSELENVCNKFCFVRNGTIISYKNALELKKVINKHNYIFELSSINLENILSDYVVVDDNHVKVCCKKDKLNKIMNKIIKKRINIYEVRNESSSLEKIFLKVMEDGKNG